MEEHNEEICEECAQAIKELDLIYKVIRALLDNPLGCRWLAITFSPLTPGMLKQIVYPRTEHLN